MSQPPADSSRSGRRRLVIGLVAFGFVAAVGYVLWSDREQLWEIMREVEPATLTIPVLLGLLSYAAMARSYQGIASAAGVDLSYNAWIRITFVSNTVNYIVVSGGLSGLAVRMMLLSRHGVASGRAVVISFVQTFLTNFTLLLFIMAGLGTLAMREQVPRVEVIAGIVAVIVFGLVLGFATALVVNRRLRRLTLFFLSHRVHQVLQRFVPRFAPRRQRLLHFRRNLNEGFDFLMDRRDKMLWPVIWILFDWVLTLAILWYAFRALNNPVPATTVLIGFGVAVLASLISLVPGGLGIMEGSMTAVFVSVGVPKQVALLAALIFRVSYHVTPLLVSVFLFRGLFKQAMNTLENAPPDV